MKMLGSCLFRVAMIVAVLWVVACLVANWHYSGTLLPGFGL